MTPRKVTFILGCFAVGALFSYIILASQLTAFGYTLEAKEQRLFELEESEGRYIVELARAQNPASLEDRSASLGLVDIGTSLRYLDTRSTDLSLVQNQQAN